MPGRLVSGDTFFLDWRWLLCPHMSFPLYVGGVSASSYKDVSPVVLGTTLLTLLPLIISLKSLYLQYSHFQS